MLALAGLRMGLHIRTLSPEPSGSMVGLGESMVGDWNDKAVLASFAEGCTVVTVESEWAPLERLSGLLPDDPLWPRPETLRRVRDKGLQKRTLAAAGLPTPAFACCASPDEAVRAASRFGYPALCKRFHGSYDGYGNATVYTAEEVRVAWDRLADRDGLLVEAWAPFVRELSVLVARRPGGEVAVYPVAYTEQRDHRCHAVVVPAGVSPAVAAEARRVALAAVKAFDGVGVTGVELFELADGRVLVNELAPRPHNTGHYTIEGSHTSQFENHLRAVLDWPLGDPGMRTDCSAMVNVIGRHDGPATIAGLSEALAVPGAAIHLYGKETVKRRRKMGHVTTTGTDPDETRARAERAATLLAL
jgi:5-(carboxyamino)imidazole ribonucleotide synthase